MTLPDSVQRTGPESDGRGAVTYARAGRGVPYGSGKKIIEGFVLC
jgi:hypothetical protein